MTLLPAYTLAACLKPQCQTSAGCICEHALRPVREAGPAPVVPTPSTMPSTMPPEPADYVVSGGIVTERFRDGTVEVPSEDGRHMRKARTRAALLEACRSQMCTGVFQPSMESVCAWAAVSNRSGFQHFGSIDELRLEAIQDAGTRQSIATRILGDELPVLTPEAVTRLVRAVVLGWTV